jgi:predicted amidohydrolase
VAQTIRSRDRGDCSRGAQRERLCHFRPAEREGDVIYNSLAVVARKATLPGATAKSTSGSPKTNILARWRSLRVHDRVREIGSIICYDIMYPEYVRAVAAKGAGVITHSTAW